MLCHWNDSASCFCCFCFSSLSTAGSECLKQLLALCSPLHLIGVCLLLLFGFLICSWSLGTLDSGAVCSQHKKEIEIKHGPHQSAYSRVSVSMSALESTAQILGYYLKVFYSFISSFSWRSKPCSLETTWEIQKISERIKWPIIHTPKIIIIDRLSFLGPFYVEQFFSLFLHNMRKEISVTQVTKE